MVHWPAYRGKPQVRSPVERLLCMRPLFRSLKNLQTFSNIHIRKPELISIVGMTAGTCIWAATRKPENEVKSKESLDFRP